MIMKNKYVRAAAVIILAVFIAVTTCGLIYFRHQARQIYQIVSEDSSYRKHYAFICYETSDDFYQDIYNAVFEEGRKNGDYVEFMGKDLNADYSVEELLQIAIDAKIDGIILEGYVTGAITRMIDKAVEAGIPVVTIVTDNAESKRQSFVGISYYSLGTLYAEEIMKHATPWKQKIIVLTGVKDENANQNILFGAIREALDKGGMGDRFTLESKTIVYRVPFQSVQEIGDLIMDNKKRPDMLICLTREDTSCACQALIDYNMVGETRVFGYDVNEKILSAIEKNILTSTIAVDTHGIGANCISVLDEYQTDGFVNEYIPMDLQVVNADNAAAFRQQPEEEEEVQE